MRPVFTSFAIALFLAPPVHAQQIAADRPGVGSAPTVVPQFTLEPELGTDGKEIRLGVLPGFELDRDDTSWGAKLALANSEKFKLAFKASYDNDLHAVLELPANYTFNALFNLGTTVIWSHSSQTYAAEFNVTPTGRLTITPTLYYESKARAAIFVAWIVPHHDNWQLDISYDQHRISAGISTAIDIARLLKKR
ncbi:MAG: hypothetical protein M3N34_03965 [Pseudomonadota bacterium]|nr:hypothetical protein [Pseudomonadota bacterium]